MNKKQFSIDFEEYSTIEELQQEDSALLSMARSLTFMAYAPYSNFRVAAVAVLNNGEIIKGTNQENASYPVGICAERSLMAAVGTMFPDAPIKTMAISYHNAGNDGHPISPCGMCRQALQEYEERTRQSIRLILSGQSGSVYVIDKASSLLPLAFSGKELKSEKTGINDLNRKSG